MNNSNLPGRLGNPQLTVTKDPRIDPRVAALLEMGEGLPEIEPPVNATYEESLAFCNEFEAQDTVMHPAQLEMMPDFCLLYTSPSPRDGLLSRMPSSA